MATVAVIADDEHVPELRAALEARGVVLAEPGEVSPDHPLVVVPAGLAKGLEFDAVIVVEPTAIAAHEPHGVRLLFVALTARCSTWRSPTAARCRRCSSRRRLRLRLVA